MSTVTVDLPDPYPDDTEFPYWSPESGQQIGVDGPGLVSVEVTARHRIVDVATARAFAGALLAAAKVAEDLDRQAFPCVVDDCPARFVSYAALNRHSRIMHAQHFICYPGSNQVGDFAWHTDETSKP